MSFTLKLNSTFDSATESLLGYNFPNIFNDDLVVWCEWLVIRISHRKRQKISISRFFSGPPSNGEAFQTSAKSHQSKSLARAEGKKIVCETLKESFAYYFNLFRRNYHTHYTLCTRCGCGKESLVALKLQSSSYISFFFFCAVYLLCHRHHSFRCFSCNCIVVAQHICTYFNSHKF